MHEEPPVGLEPRADPAQELRVVARVLHHLDREDAIEAATGLEDVGVGRPDLDAAQAAPSSLGLDPLALEPRVGDGRAPGPRGYRSASQKRQRAPPAAEVEDLHPVLDAGARAGELEHRVLGLGE